MNILLEQLKVAESENDEGLVNRIKDQIVFLLTHQ